MREDVNLVAEVLAAFEEDPELRRGRARGTRNGGMTRRASRKQQAPQRQI